VLVLIAIVWALFQLEDVSSTSVIQGQKAEQNLQYGLLTKISLSLNGQQVRACNSKLLSATGTQ
jgi:hypothetical protein